MKGSNQGNFLRHENKFPSSSFPTSIAISLFLAAFISPCPQSDNSLYHGTDFAWWPYLLPSPCLLGILSPAQGTLESTVPTASSSCSELNLSFINRMSSNRNCSRRIIPGQSSPRGIYCKSCLWTATQLDLARVCLSHLTFPPKWRRGQQSWVQRACIQPLPLAASARGPWPSLYISLPCAGKVTAMRACSTMGWQLCCAGAMLQPHFVKLWKYSQGWQDTVWCLKCKPWKIPVPLWITVWC